ncbi:multidrug resistance-associated ABC transporter [Crucibulum laeve]|uniref:Multidrug resistance-associated ABC transporter n=1 Tax=Crucibulum laeve TaxID=68775 RepID=A0A5C3LZJ1_9AGAR|nr:multidrug resistance-associated ABC transporter [Crucibulum laeve]
MNLRFCGDYGPFDFHNVCVRATWGACLPAALVFAICLYSIPTPRPVRKFTSFIKAPFVPFLTLHEAGSLEAHSASGDAIVAVEMANIIPLWRTIVFVFAGLFQTLFWIVNGSYLLYSDRTDVWEVARAFLLAITWLYTAVRPITHPTATPPYDLFSIYITLFITSTLQLGGILFDNGVSGVPLPPMTTIIAISANLLLIGALLLVVLNIPLAIPSSSVKKDDIGKAVSLEDYTPLWKWITFAWIRPLVQLGRKTTLNEEDVPNLSPTMRSRPVFMKFESIHRPTLLRKLWAANSQDIFVVLNYAGPFFLKHILDAISYPTPESRGRAYIYAFLAFVCTVMKAQADLYHLWFSRRGSVRVRSQMMAAIYDKALKRKDYSGIIAKDKEEETITKETNNRQGGKGKAAADDPKAGADVGKIVNLMANDANRLSMTVSGAHLIYGAPFEIIIAGTFLYQLLGLSAFAGFTVLIVGWPLNSLLAQRRIRMHKSIVAARDKRMAILNELIGAIKFIKFFAWEDRWIRRVLDAREVEMKWMTKSRINSVLLHILWTCGPILVSVICFFVYVMQGNELTVSVAFTAIALFSMIRAPLNVIPNWIVQVLQAGVALERVAVYLDEDEVTDQVSSLKKDHSDPHLLGSDDEGLGLSDASLKWNEVPDDRKQDKSKDKSRTSTASVHSSNTIASDSTSLAEPASQRFELRDINVRFPEGELSVITGPTASGKTALLMALLGEMTLVSGKIIMSKNPSMVDENGHIQGISYAAQSPWLQHRSIKDNVLFGYPYDEERYNLVIKSCALEPDLVMLEDGDATEIGARGVNLSGGQKARVALARAVYARTKYVLLDDPLSAVDSHTSRFLYEKLLRGPLLANRTVILVTHHVQLVLPGAYYFVRMLDGRIDAQGTVKDLRVQGFLDEVAYSAAVETKEEEKAESETPAVANVDGVSKASITDVKKSRKFVKDEHREIGGVKWSIYKKYLKASSYWIWAFLVSVVVVNQLLGIGEKLWIKTWGEAYGNADSKYVIYAYKLLETSEHQTLMDGYLTHSQRVSRSMLPSTTSLFGGNWPSATQHPLFYVSIYAAIGLASTLVSTLSVTAQYTGGLKAARILFKELLVTVVRATFKFHDTTPQGRMLNRFGKDVTTIDGSLTSSLQSVNSSLANFFAAILTVAVVFPYFLIPALFIGLAYRELAIGYLNTGRDLRRMESNSRSPIFSDFGEILEGIVTVRAFSAERRFFDNLHTKIDMTTKMFYAFWMTNRWLLLNFDTLGGLAVLITTLFSIATLGNDAGLAGLSITSAMAFTTSVYWACRMWTTLELDLNAVERVVEYLDLPQEPPAVIESNRVPVYWPSNSNKDALISVENLVVKYAPDLPAVLRDVSFTVKAGERVGLLGRTGAGKSTLAMSILRFMDPVSGRIVVDGIDISTIGVHDLRSRLTFIPQDATLFSGTIRENLDPFEEHDDSECLDVLYRVQMITTRAKSQEQSDSSSHPAIRPPSVTDVEGETTVHTIDTASTTITEIDTKLSISLDTQVSAGGGNFSHGQRQLIAMARALLRRSSIIVLDEATSSIDFATDAKIQTTIREEFTNSLLLTVAHRLSTIIDYDRLIVLDKGQIAEFDTPYNLIQIDGIFRNMCLQSGSFSELEAAAKAKAEHDQK